MVSIVDGKIEYDPNGQFESLKAGETTTDTFTYTIDDGKGGTDTASVTVTITGENDAPNGGADAARTDEDSPVVIPVLANDSDPDGDTLSVSSVDTSGTLGSVTINPDGTITYDPSGKFGYLEPGETATDTFTYTIIDEHGLSSTVTVTVTVGGCHDGGSSCRNLWVEQSDEVEDEVADPFLASYGPIPDVGTGDHVSAGSDQSDEGDPSAASRNASDANGEAFGDFLSRSVTLFAKAPDFDDVKPEDGLRSNQDARGEVNDVTGLYGYEAGVARGKVLVFNFDEIRIADFTTRLTQTPVSDPHTGIMGSYEKTHEGNVRVFDLAKMTLGDLLTETSFDGI